MSGDERPIHQVVLQHVTDLGNHAYQAVADTIGDAGRRIGDRSTGSTAGGGASPPASDDQTKGMVDLANEIVGMLVNTAAQIAERVVKAAGDVGTVVVNHPATGPLLAPLRTVGQAAVAPAVTSLHLPDVTPGRSTTATMELRNDSNDELDALRLRCGGLFGPGELRIGGQHVRFSPLTVDVRPTSIAEVTCSVETPPETKRGHYVGLVEAVGVAGVQLLVVLDVV